MTNYSGILLSRQRTNNRIVSQYESDQHSVFCLLWGLKVQYCFYCYELIPVRSNAEYFLPNSLDSTETTTSNATNIRHFAPMADKSRQHFHCPEKERGRERERKEKEKRNTDRDKPWTSLGQPSSPPRQWWYMYIQFMLLCFEYLAGSHSAAAALTCALELERR